MCEELLAVAVTTSASVQWGCQLVDGLKASELVDDTTTVWKDSDGSTDRRRNVVSGFEKYVFDVSFFQGIGKRQARNPTADNDNLESLYSHAEAGAISKWGTTPTVTVSRVR